MSMPSARRTQTSNTYSSIAKTQDISAITPSHRFKGHTGIVWGVKHLPGGQRIITCSLDGSLRVWDLESGKQVGKAWRDGEGAVQTIALSLDGKRVVSGSEDGVVRLWDIDAGKVVARWMGHRAYVSSVRWSRDGRRVLSGSNDGTARQWKVENGETILAPIETGHKHVYVATYSPDRALIATAGYDKSIKIWDAKTNNLVTTLHTDKMVNCLAWTPDGTVLISGSFDHSIRTWSTRRWQQIAALYAHTDCVFAIAVSPNGRILASASYDNTARLWNLENGQPISLPLKHADIVTSVSFSADGKLLATGCYDRDAYTWDVSAILRDAGRVDLLSNLNEREKPLLDAATRRLAQQLEYVHQAPPAVVDSSRDHVGSSTYQPPYSSTWHGHATSAPSSALDRFPSSSTSQHELATSAPSSSPHRYQPDADVAPQISPHPPSAFSSPTPRTVGQRTSRVYVAPRGPITQATSQRQVRQDPNQGRAPLFPVAVVPTTYPPSSLSPPRPRPQVPVSIIPPTVTPITQETGCCTRFWRSICCGCNDSSDDHS